MDRIAIKRSVRIADVPQASDIAGWRVRHLANDR